MKNAELRFARRRQNAREHGAFNGISSEARDCHVTDALSVHQRGNAYSAPIALSDSVYPRRYVADLHQGCWCRSVGWLHRPGNGQVAILAD